MKLNWKIAGWVMVVLVFGASLFYLWKFWYPEYAREKETQDYYKKLLETDKEYKESVENALRADTFGGKTPQETLDLFVDALKKEDIELAAKYFVFNTDAEVFGTEEFLGRKEWEDALKQAKEEGRLEEIANNIDKAEVIDKTEEYKKAYQTLKNTLSISEEDYIKTAMERDKDKADFVTSNKEERFYISLQLNPLSQVWKIESL